MFQIKKEGILLKKTSLNFENEAVMNPAAIREGNHVYMFYRAVRKGNYSSIGFCKLNGPLTVDERHTMPVIFPQYEYENQGIEDPRIVKIENTYYLTYTAYDGVNALGALATSNDLINFEKKGIIVPQMTYDEFSHLAESKGEINEKYFRYNEHLHIRELKRKKLMIWDKNLIFFPRKINNKLYFLHRIKPDIQIVCINSLEELTVTFWQNYFLKLDCFIVLSPKYDFEVSYIGGGCPPIETESGWLLIYHAVHDTVNGYVYTAGAALLDLEHPEREIARLKTPLFKPEHEWEIKGAVSNVCFPTGAVVFGETLYIYYGAADERIACASVCLTELIEELLNNSI